MRQVNDNNMPYFNQELVDLICTEKREHIKDTEDNNKATDQIHRVFQDSPYFNEVNRNTEKEDAISNTIKAICYSYFKLLDTLQLTDNQIQLDYFILNDLTDRFWKDVKNIHSYDKITTHRISGYLCYWICKLRPLSVIDQTILNKDNLSINVMNELLAVFCVIGRLNAHLIDSNSNKRIKISANFMNSLLYTLRYSPLNPELLSLIFTLLEETSQ
ncbi:hypothetical protein H1S01_15450 [Heliobacterium chlorum]|uniref:Uncharacterized protein n=1 Tax=Heliobacterium chlorum TaxID=2698 RepID=A0ABR7T5E7_HELCL|nr:hypothetical protein [Heliobacterium chlorum]MBC9785881.1 hypothetical protein [Heliobacterium chlorum]